MISCPPPRQALSQWCAVTASCEILLYSSLARGGAESRSMNLQGNKNGACLDRLLLHSKLLQMQRLKNHRLVDSVGQESGPAWRPTSGLPSQAAVKFGPGEALISRLIWGRIFSSGHSPGCWQPQSLLTAGQRHRSRGQLTAWLPVSEGERPG